VRREASVREADRWRGSGGTGRFPRRTVPEEQMTTLDHVAVRREASVREADRWQGARFRRSR